MSIRTEFPFCASYDADQDYCWRKSCEFCHTDKLPTLRWNIRMLGIRSITNIGYFCQKLCAERYFFPTYQLHRLAGDLATFKYDRTKKNPTDSHAAPG
jgi:hypothetical protein